MNQPTSFAITPDQRDLDRSPRYLRFHPCTNKEPRTLTPAQIEQFNRDGFLKGIGVFSAEEADANRRYFDDLPARELAAGGVAALVAVLAYFAGPTLNALAGVVGGFAASLLL
jgi:hypothetical protein